LIGNRADLEEEREVSRDRAIEFCKQYNIDKFFETSAKTGFNVEEVFSLAAKELYAQSKDTQQEDDETKVEDENG
jgi:GTPase SAR1 family protein